MRVVVVLVAAALLAACGAPVPGSVEGGGVTGGAQVLRDVAYAPAEPASSQGHLLDLHLPARSGRPVPVVIWSHGSGWLQENGRDGADVVAARLNPLGIAVAGVAVRSSANAQFPGQLHDIKSAIRHLRGNADRYGLDPERFATMGESSGGWAATMAAVTGDVPELEGSVGVTGPSSSVAAAVPFYPPTDFLQMDEHMIDCAYFDAAFGLQNCHSDPRSPESLLLGCPITTCPDRVAAANPITYVGAATPPFLILHGTGDRLVPHHQGLLLHEALSAAGADTTLVTVPDGAHGAWAEWLSGAAGADGSSASIATAGRQRSEPTAPSWETVIAFLERTIAAP